MSTRKLRYLLISFIVFIVSAGMASSAAAISMENDSIEWLYGKKSGGSGYERNL
ncbi:MAG: hypothetical protein O8C61_01875 [Candidatus Methanoperedens sp.]|nr:hypothetical protein [Candidatus Methanoperedens sp.]